jgi:hypothetical protein
LFFREGIENEIGDIDPLKVNVHSCVPQTATGSVPSFFTAGPRDYRYAFASQLTADFKTNAFVSPRNKSDFFIMFGHDSSLKQRRLKSGSGTCVP